MPLINIVFLLLIFFMVAGQLTRTEKVVVKPPISESDSEPANAAAPVLVTAEGMVFVASMPTSIDAVGTAIRDRILDGDNRIVHVKADAAVEARHLISIFNQIKQAGAESVRLVTTRHYGQ